MTTFSVNVPAHSGGVLSGTFTVDGAPIVPYEAFASYTDELQVGLGSKFTSYLASKGWATARVQFQAKPYYFSDFSQSGYSVLQDKCTGFATGGIDKTYFILRPRTSTKAALVPAQSAGGTNPLFMMRVGANQVVNFTGGFTLVGTDQGHLYNGLSMYKWAAGSYMDPFKVTGVPGDHNSPPGECFAVDCYRVAGVTIGQPGKPGLEVDGYQYTPTINSDHSIASWAKSAAPVGGSPFGGNLSQGIVLHNPNFHDSHVSMPTFYQCGPVTTTGLVSRLNGNTTPSNGLGSVGINHEQCGTVSVIHDHPVINMQGAGAYSAFVGNISGSTKTKIIAPTWSGLDTRAKGAFIVQVPNTYAGVKNSQNAADVTVLGADGVTPLTPFDAGVNWANAVPATIDPTKQFVLLR